MSTNITPSSVKLKYLKCLESKFLNFYPSRKVLVKVSAGSSRPFEVRYCPALVSKKSEVAVNRVFDGAEVSNNKPRNPFLPFDQNLLVSELSRSHVLIFNKFCVVPEHLLIITTKFVEQAAEFAECDFDAVNQILEDMNEVFPLAFYNSGPEAGASQAHRHFQVIPTEIAPIDEHIRAVDKFNEPFAIPLYSSFLHGCIRNPSVNSRNSYWHFEAYKQLRELFPDRPAAYNLLWTRDWMLLVPRRKAFTDNGMDSVNAMAFAGYFLTMDEVHLDEFNVIQNLQEVTFPKTS